MKQVLSSFFLCLVVSLHCCSQDFTYSQYLVNRVHLNPACLAEQSGLRLSTLYRNQWSGINPAYQSTSTSLSSDLGLNWPAVPAFGMHINNDVEGEGNLRSLNIGFGTAVRIMLFEDRVSLYTGGKFSRITTNINWDALTFSDELHPIYGIYYESTAVSPAELPVVGHGVDFGAMLVFSLMKRISGDIGFSLNHMKRATVALSNGPNRSDADLYKRLTIHGELFIPFHPKGQNFVIPINLEPHFKFDRSANLQNLAIGLNLSSNFGFIGTYRQHRTFLDEAHIGAWGFMAGINGKTGPFDLQIAASYDLNDGAVPQHNTQGVFELSLVFTNPARFSLKSRAELDSKKWRMSTKDCPKPGANPNSMHSSLLRQSGMQ